MQKKEVLNNLAYNNYYQSIVENLESTEQLVPIRGCKGMLSGRKKVMVPKS